MIRRILVAIGRFLVGVARLPFDILRSIVGGHGPDIPPPAAFEHLADGEADSLRDELRAPVRATPPAVMTVGGHVHGYAVAEDRTAYDLSPVPADIAVALLSMDERQLAVLAAAGPEACGRWAAGQRSGIVGLPAVSATTPAAPPEPRHAPAAEGRPHGGMPLRLVA